MGGGPQPIRPQKRNLTVRPRENACPPRSRCVPPGSQPGGGALLSSHPAGGQSPKPIVLPRDDPWSRQTGLGQVCWVGRPGAHFSIAPRALPVVYTGPLAPSGVRAGYAPGGTGRASREEMSMIGGFVDCPWCQGLKVMGCPTCGGSGRLSVQAGVNGPQTPCPACQGNGICQCTACQGTGVKQVVPF